MMSGIKAKDTKPEMIIRKALHAAGFRYRLHVRDLPGRPDLVFPKYKAVIFVHGCFWHGHDCRYFKLPSTRTEFWERKIADNKSRDAQNIAELFSKGWKVIVVWECTTRQQSESFSLQNLTIMLAEFLSTGDDCIEISCAQSKVIICSKISIACSNASDS
jgi:DNA mismatch endonuclease (patch repair protein)